MPLDPLTESLAPLVSNEMPMELPAQVAFIIGESPSRGARSPKLWNAAFDAFGMDAKMFPLDVSAGDVEELLATLRANRRVIGIAVAAPHKALVAQLLGESLSAAALRCGSVNLISRDSDGDFVGFNTDGIAAVESLREACPSFASQRILVLGCGGTGRAVISSLLDYVEPAQIVVAVRNQVHQAWLSDQGLGIESMSLDKVNLASFGVVANCTSIGWGHQEGLSPLSVDQIDTLSASCTVFDVVYQPDPTKLIDQARAHGLNSLSGGRMNILQAVIAFATAVSQAKLSVVESAMLRTRDL